MHARLGVFLALCMAAVSALGAISGTVMTFDGAPIAGARVSIRAIESFEARTARLLSDSPEMVPIASAQTDAKGNYSFESPKDGVVELLISASGYEPVSRRIERDEDVGAIALSRAETRTGRITSGDGKPVAGAVVVVSYGPFQHQVKTDEEGRFDAPDPKRATRITVVHPEFAIDEESFALPGGANAGELTRTLSRGVETQGKVVGADGQTAVAGAAVFLDGWPLATSGEDGTFAIAHTPSVWQTLRARKESLVAQRPHSKDASHTLRLGKPATVSGRVTDAKTKVPIAGAVVMANTRRTGPVVRSEPPNTTITDAKGRYTLALTPGTYWIAMSHPAYSDARSDVAVTAGQQATKDLAPSQYARISGFVLDEAKRPVAAAAVVPENADDMSAGGAMRFMRFEDRTVSGPDGRFSLRTETESEVWVRAVKRGLPAAKSDSLTLAPGERKGGVVVTIPSGIAVSGRVTDKEGNPLSGVGVTAAEADPRGMMRFVSGFAQRDDDAVRSASDGTFTLRVREGTYDFSFRADGYATKVVRGQTVSPTASPTVEASLEPAVEITGRVTRGGMPVENARIMAFGGESVSAMSGADGSFALTGLTPGNVRLMVRKDEEFINETRALEAPARDVIIDVKPGGRITGRVTEKSSGKAITIFQAGISTSGGGGGMVRMSPPQLRDFNSDDGSFTLDNVPAGAMALIVNAPGYASARMNITVEEGKTVSGTEVQLDAGVKLTGRVTGPDGTALPDAMVRLMPSASGGFSMSGMDRATPTDANGEYTFEALAAGEETVMVMHPKYVSSRKQVTLKGRETRHDVQLAAGQKITGVVVTESGAPVAEAEVQVSGTGRGDNARTNASGAFEIEGLPAGRYRFHASKAGYATGILEDVDVSSGAPVRITLRTGGTIHGRLTGISERELEKATVEARSNRESASASVDAAGNFRIEGAPIGTVHVSASVFTGTNYRSSPSKTVEVAAGSSQQVDIGFRGDIAIRGRVTRNGAPLASASVTFLPRVSMTGGMANANTDDQGMYTITGIEEGEYTVQVMDSQRYNPYATSYTVRGSDTFDIDYKTASVRGHVADVASNESIANATVQFRPAQTGTGDSTMYMSYMMTRGATTDANGLFILDSIAPGAYAVTVSKEGYGNQVMDLTVGSSSIDNLEMKLSKNDGVTLKIVDARDGSAIRGFATVFDMQGRVVHERSMFGGGSDTGELKLPLAPGSYSAFVAGSGYAGRNMTIQSPSTITVPLTPGGTMVVRSKHSERRRVRILDANGLPYWRMSAATPSRDLNASPGLTTFQNVAAGTYTLQLLGDNDVVVDTEQVVVAEGRTVDVEI